MSFLFADIATALWPRHAGRERRTHRYVGRGRIERNCELLSTFAAASWPAWPSPIASFLYECGRLRLLGATYFWYAAIQSVAMSCWAVASGRRPAHTSRCSVFSRHVFDVRVPWRRPVRLRPQIAFGVRAAELEADEVVDLVFALSMVRNVVSAIHVSLDLGGHVANLATVTRCADVRGRHREGRTRRQDADPARSARDARAVENGDC